jgi:hypothetical protein
VYKTRVQSHLNINIKPEKNHETQFSMNKILNNEIEKKIIQNDKKKIETRRTRIKIEIQNKLESN